MMYASFGPGLGVVSFLLFVAFWVGVGTLLVWVSKSHLRDRNLLLTGLVLLAASIFLSSVIALSFHAKAGARMMQGGDVDRGWMMGDWDDR